MIRQEEWNLQEVLVRTLDSRVSVEGEGRRKTRSRRELVLRMLITKAMEGNATVLKVLLDYQGERSGRNRFWVKGPSEDTRAYLRTLDRAARDGEEESDD